jgi:streptogramin lyase
MIRRSIATLLCATLTACGGGASRVTPSVTPTVTQTSAALRGALVMHIPSRTGTGSAALRRIRYVSASTQSASVKIAPAAGCTQCSAPVTIEAALTPSSPGCSTNANGTTCTLALALVAGSYTGTMSTYDGPLDAQGTPTGKRLSVNGTFPISIAGGSQNLIGVTLSGIPASLKLSPKSTNWFASAYVIGYGSGTTVVPILRLLGANTVGQAFITAYDADGNAIAGAGAPTSFTMSSNKFTASVAGNVATITSPATVDPYSRLLKLIAQGPACVEPEATCSTYTSVGFEELLAIADPGTGSGAVYLVPVDAKTFAPVTTITTGISGPVSVTFDRNGTLFVANSTGANVGIYAPPYTGAPTVVTSGITDPRLIALAHNNTLFVANRTGAHVTVLPPPYTTSTSFAVTDARGFAFDGFSKAYISDYANNAIATSSLPYTALDSNSLSGPATTLNGPSGLAINAKGELWVANTLSNALLRFPVSALNTSPNATIVASNDLKTLNAPSVVAVVDGGTTLLAITPNSAASFNEATQVTLAESQLQASPSSQIAIDLAGTAWFANGQSGTYNGFGYPYTTPNAYVNIFGSPLTAPADIAVYP